jgi:hypothetical protein
MATFRYYITDLGAGSVVGTNDDTAAHDYALSEDNFVVDTLTGLWLQADEDSVEIKEIVR